MTMRSKKEIQNQLQTRYMQNNEPKTVCGEVGKQNRTQTHSQSGRSMIEMLGVLAIIAILSIGGIVGYKLAMNYYQADQIANEINLMRNDLKVKYALGNEELLLGDPYDDTPENKDYSGHLSTQYDRYPVDYDCIRKDKAEFYNCRETDAYYIKVGNVSKGVCKPLATLLNGMDGLMYIEINKQPYEDDSCTSDENNEIYVEFDAADVDGNYDSNRPDGWCADDDDCDASRPICDIENNECVECTVNADCADSGRPRCNVEQGSCESCPPETPVWYNNRCVECVTSADCENPKPYCNPNNQCAPCENDSQCDITQNEHCTSAGECVVCEDGSEWDEETKECMSCTERECTDNDDCCENYFCRKGLAPLPDGDNIVEINKTAHSNSRGTCEPLGEVKSISLKANQTFYGSDKFIIWWDACRWCEALHGQSGSQCDSNTYESNYMVGIEEIDWQCPGYGNFSAPQREVYCCYADGAEKNPQGSPSSYYGEMVCDANKEKSSTIKKLKTLYSDQDVYIWFKNYFRGADSWRIAFANLYQGYISNNGGARYDDKTAGRARTICK